MCHLPFMLIISLGNCESHKALWYFALLSGKMCRMKMNSKLISTPLAQITYLEPRCSFFSPDFGSLDLWICSNCILRAKIFVFFTRFWLSWPLNMLKSYIWSQNVHFFHTILALVTSEYAQIAYLEPRCSFFSHDFGSLDLWICSNRIFGAKIFIFFKRFWLFKTM